MSELINKYKGIFKKISISSSELLPSEYAEKNRTLHSDVSTLQGKFKYKYTPYLREVVDTLSPYHPAKVVGIMKGAQIGLTEGLLVNGILWIIANNPGNIMALSANDDLSREMVESRLDSGIASCGITHLIRPNTIRKRNNRTGDTSKSKEFAGGRLFAGGLKSIDKLGKQRSIKYGFFDDWDSAPISDKDQGSIFDLIQQRFSTAAHSMKQYYISTPENKPSNIEKVYLMGDQRKWKVPCPECGEYIELLWSEKKGDKRVGIVFEATEDGDLIEDSVGYVCQECGEFWKEKHKHKINQKGKWVPTAKPSRPGYYSYHIPAWAAAPHMYGWTHYAYQWLEIFKSGQESKSKLRVFKNIVMGLPFEERMKNVSSNKLAKNTRNYEIGTVPTKLSRDHGNGEIVLITCACDLNGTLDDARLDYEVVAWSETGSSYSIDHGSVGTYWPKKKKDNRDLWTYRNESPNNVWDYFLNEILSKDYITDENFIMKIAYTGIDTGVYTHYAYELIDSYPEMLIGLKGDSNEIKMTRDMPCFKPGRERPGLYILATGKIKDDLAERIDLKWSDGNIQPAGFMNFPIPSDNKYTVSRFFTQYEQETKEITRNDDGDQVSWKWVRKNSHAHNHYWDVAVYNIAVRDIFAKKVCKDVKIKNPTWADFVNLVKQISGKQ